MPASTGDPLLGTGPLHLQEGDVLGGLLRELLGVQVGHVLELGRDHPLAHVPCVVVQALPEVVAQDVSLARLEGAQLWVGDL